MLSTDACLSTIGGSWFMLMHYGNIDITNREVDKALMNTPKLMNNPMCASFGQDVCNIATSWPVACHFLGRSDAVKQLYSMLDFTFANVIDRMQHQIVKQAVLFIPYETEGGRGLFSLTRIIWKVKALMILHCDVPQEDAVEFLHSLPDSATMVRQSLAHGTHDQGQVVNLYQYLWLALAHEKVGLYEGALRMAELGCAETLVEGMNPNIWCLYGALFLFGYIFDLKGASESNLSSHTSPLTHHFIVLSYGNHRPPTYACRGRVLAALGKHEEARRAFQAGVDVSKTTFRLSQALALRDLADYLTSVGDDAPAEVAARRELATAVAAFGGKLTDAQFSTIDLR
jgi:hypothetical protein